MDYGAQQGVTIYKGKLSYIAPNAAVETVVDTTRPVTFRWIVNYKWRTNPTFGLNVGNPTYRLKTLYIATATALFMNLPPVGEMNAANLTPFELLADASFESRPTPVPYELSSVGRELSLFALHEQLDRIASLPANWDGRRSARPNQAAVENARQLLEDTYRQTARTISWQSPYLSSSEDGEIVLEWWNGIRKLTIYVGPDQSTYIKSWGPHLLDEMEDGVLPADWIPLLWTWLFQ
jgi:hypothetical protein